MKLSKLTASRPTEATIEVLGEPISLTYDRALLNGQKRTGGSSARAVLAQILLDWDITHDDGTPYTPPASANGNRPAEWLKLLDPLPDDVIGTVWTGILDDLYAEKKAGGGSSVS